MQKLNSAMARIAHDAGDQTEQSVYLSDARERSFFLWELFQVDKEFLGMEPATDLTREAVTAQLVAAHDHASRLAAAYQESDREPARLQEDGSVKLPSSYYALWQEHRRDWFNFRQQGDSVLAGEGESARSPHLVNQMIGEMFIGANPSFMTYAGFTPSACNLLRLRGTQRQRDVMLSHLESVEWDACFCATEADAGTDLVAVSMTGYHIEGDIYGVSGHKKFITAGMHDLTSNTIYIVLGRMRDAKTNSLSLSCFLVPRYWPEEDGSLSPNYVSCAKVEAKMGLNGCANTHLVFGEGGTTRGFLLGNQANVALLQLASLMRKARVGTGSMALAMASSAYLHSVRYARARVQGASVEQVSVPGAARIAIIEHADVQRMLLEMRSKVEGCRALLGRVSYHAGKIQQEALHTPIETLRRGRHGLLLMLYGPIAKAYISDEAWQIVTQAIQVHGAIGYLKDLPLEQYARDIKILSIWEGTNFIQSQDLVLSKLGLGKEDSHVQLMFRAEVENFLDRISDESELAEERSAVKQALDALLHSLAVIQQKTVELGVLPVSQYFTRLLQSFGDVILAWNLLEAAAIAVGALRTLPAEHADHAFYRGKVKTARFFIENILPRVHANRQALDRIEHSYVAMLSEEFAFDGGMIV